MTMSHDSFLVDILQWWVFYFSCCWMQHYFCYNFVSYPRQVDHSCWSSSGVHPPLHLQLHLHLWADQRQIHAGTSIHFLKTVIQIVKLLSLVNSSVAVSDLKNLFLLEPFGASGLRLPPVSDQEQDHQRSGPFHWGSGLLHRVQPDPWSCWTLSPPQDPGYWRKPCWSQTCQIILTHRLCTESRFFSSHRDVVWLGVSNDPSRRRRRRNW